MTAIAVDPWDSSWGPPEEPEVEAYGPAPVDPDAGWSDLDLGPYLDGTHEPPRPTLLHRDDAVALVYPGRVHWLSAEPEAGKTWLALHAVAQVLDAGGEVIYVDLEDGPDGLVSRLLAFGLTTDALRTRLHYWRPTGPLNALTKQRRAEVVSRCALLVVDACTEALSLDGRDDKNGPEVAAWLESLPRWVARLGPAVLVVDHVVKDSESRGRWATGSQHKLAGLDGAAYSLEPVSPFGHGMTGRSRLCITKDRNGQVRPYAQRIAGGRDWVADLTLTSDPTTGAVVAHLEPPTVESGPFRPTAVMQRIADLLAGSSAPLSLRGIQDRLGGKAQTVRQALAALVDDGFVTVDTGPRGAHLHRLARPYPDGEPDV